MKAIVVKYKGPTNARGSRWIASAEGVRAVSVSCNDGAGGTAADAARALALKYSWTGHYVEGSLPNLDRVFVNAGREGRVDGEAFAVFQSDVDMARGMGK